VITCDKCKAEATGGATCHCGARYSRCERHGSDAGARRSVVSHRALLGRDACVPPLSQREVRP